VREVWPQHVADGMIAMELPCPLGNRCVHGRTSLGGECQSPHSGRARSVGTQTRDRRQRRQHEQRAESE
jgi:hypothetical protein